MAEVIEYPDNQTQPVSTAGASYTDVFLGVVNAYASTKIAESAREQPEPINHAFNGNTDTIHQPTLGQGAAGETIVVKNDMNYKKIGIYTGIGLGSILVLAVAYKAVK
jgi:hypothetical protein